MKLALDYALRRMVTTTAFWFFSVSLSQFTSATTFAIPGTIQAEDYISDPVTNAAVGKENTSDTGLGQNVGWIDTGDWMRYSVNVATSGMYKVTYRVASPISTAKVVLSQNSRDLGSVTSVPNTGDWQKWDYAYSSVYLSAGVQEIAVYAIAGGFNLNWFQLTPENTSSQRPLRVWPVGDSMTAGVSNNWDMWSPTNGGYRRNLMLLLNDGYKYEFIGSQLWPDLGDLPNNNSGYGGQGLSVFDKPEFTPENIRANNPDAVLLLLGINSLAHRKEYPDAQGQYWSVNGHKFNYFFTRYKSFIDQILNNSANAVVFMAKLPSIGDTRYYQKCSVAPSQCDNAIAPNPYEWLSVGNGTVNPKDIVREFNTELRALYNTYFSGNPRVVLVDLNTGLTVGSSWDDDIAIIGVPQNWWNGDGLHPTQNGYRHFAERWNTAIRAALPSTGRLLYSVDCGAKEGTAGLATEGAIKGTAQSVVWDKPYGPDAVTGKNWGHLGNAYYNSLNAPPPSDTAIYFAWEGTNTVYESVATSTPGHALTYHFEVPAGGTYRVFLGFHDTWGDNATPQGTNRQATIFIDGINKGTKSYHLKDFGRSIYEVVNTSGTLEIKLVGIGGSDALLDSIAIQRLK